MMKSKRAIIPLLWLFIFLFNATGIETEEATVLDDNSHVVYRSPDVADIEQLKQDSRYDYELVNNRPGWLARMFSRFIEMLVGQSQGLTFVSFLLIGLMVIGFVIFILRLLDIPVVGFIVFAKAGKKEELLFSDNISSDNEGKLTELLDMYRSNGAFREAVRILYLLTLRKLENCGVLELRDYKTNRDYVREIKDATLKELFSNLVKIYDHVWFGQYDPDSIMYGKIEAVFSKALDGQQKLQ